MAKKRKSRKLGYITLRNRSRKGSRMAMKGSRPSRAVGVKVYVVREMEGGYRAWACTAKPRGSGARAPIQRLSSQRAKSCGPDETGRTPTAAVKKALVALGRSKTLR